MAARRSDPEPLGVLLANSKDRAARLGGVSIDGENWRKAVGERIAARTEPGRLSREGELTIHVASAAWAQELSLLSREILERLAGFGLAAKSLRFRVRQIQPAAPRVDRKERAPSTAPLPEELRARLAGIADGELRAAIAEAAALALGRVAPATSALQGARAPRSSESKSAQQARRSPAKRAVAERKRGSRRD